MEQARRITPENGDLKVGEKVYEELPQVDFGRIAAQSAKQVISSRVREAEKIDSTKILLINKVKF